MILGYFFVMMRAWKGRKHRLLRESGSKQRARGRQKKNCNEIEIEIAMRKENASYQTTE